MKSADFPSHFCKLVEDFLKIQGGQDSLSYIEDFLLQFFKKIRLSSLQIVLTGLSLTKSQFALLVVEGKKIFRARVVDLPSSNFAEISEDSAMEILQFISHNEVSIPSIYIIVELSIVSPSILI